MELDRLPEKEAKPSEFTAFDFVAGIIHRKAKRAGGKFSFRTNDTSVHTAFKAAFDHLMERAEAEALDVTFGVYPDRIHGDSETLRTEFTFMSSLWLLKGYNGSYATVIYDAHNPSAEQLVENSHYAPTQLMDELTDVFDSHYV